MRQGDVIAGRYRLEHVVGAGGMGEVWRATDTELDRTVAVKRATADRSDLLREARMAAVLQHPNVVTLYDSVAQDDDRWLVLEYVRSRSLADLLKHAGRLTPAEVANIGSQIAAAVAAVHSAGVVHRDIKPGNILVDAEGRAKLTDFGISRRVWHDLTVTESGVFAGTPSYLSPEVAQGGEPTAASDVFALGATLYAAVEGEPPFGRADNPLVVLRRAADNPVPPARSAGPLRPVLAALLSRRPADRPDAAAAHRMLAAVTAELGGAAPPVPPVPVRASRTRWWNRRWLAVAGTAVVVLLAAVISVPLLRPASVPGSPVAAPAGSVPGPDAPAPAGPATLGDVHTADPCALVDKANFGQYGPAEVDPNYANFSRCDVVIATKDDDLLANVSVEFGDTQSDQEDDSAPSTEVGPIRVQRPKGDDDQCHRTLVLPDNNHVIVQAGSGHQAPVDLCALADLATSTALTRLAAGPVPRRSTQPPANSLFWVDACGLLDDRALALLPGLNPRLASAATGHWTCYWEHKPTLVQIRFDQGAPPDTDDGTPITLAGRQAFVAPSFDGQDTCEVSVVHRTFTGTSGQRKAEVAQLFVYGDLKVEQKCVIATTMATTVASKLPKV